MRRRGEKQLQATVERLAARVGELESELARRPSLPSHPPGWREGDEEDVLEPEVEHQWLSLLEPPVRRRRRLPRLPFELAFLALCAVAAGVADLEPLWIAAAMAAAWLLVALTEWAATLADRRRDERAALPPPALVPVTQGRPDRAWYIPPVEQTIAHGVFADAGTAIRRPAEADSATMITRLPSPPAEAETTMERRATDVTQA